MNDAAGESESPDPNDRWIAEFLRAVERLTEAGMAESDAAARSIELMFDTMEASGPRYAESLEEHGLPWVAEVREFRAGFQDRLRHRWGDALDLYEVFVATIEEASRIFAARNIGTSGERDLLLDTLWQMNGQALRVAREVHALLTAGFPLGALSLARTIHEISVRVSILSTFGREQEHQDLAEKFRLHDQIINYKDAVVYQRDAERLGYEPLDDATVEQMRIRHDDLIARFGKSFRTPYGWASGLPGLPSEPNFEQLEKVASLDHHRGRYRWSSHIVHGDSKAIRLSRVERAGREVVLVSETNSMLADPAQHALISLNLVFVEMVIAADPFSFYDHMVCAALKAMLDKVNHMFVDAEKAVDAAEEQLQADLAERGLRFDPILGEVEIELSAGT